jgi:hypothetical protein
MERMLGKLPDYSIDEAPEWAAPMNRAAESDDGPRVIERAEEARQTTIASAHSIYLAGCTVATGKKRKPRAC